MRTLQLLLTGAAALFATQAMAVDPNMDATLVKFKVYKFAVSTSKACTSPITVFSSTDGVQEDMLAGPTFGSGTLAAGTYPCIMIEVSSVINVAGSNNGTTDCSAAWDDVICGATSQTIDGTAVTCNGDPTTPQHVTLFITTAATTRNGNNSLLPPTSETDTTHGIPLASPLVVTADASGTLKIDKHFLVASGASSCGTKAPLWSFE